MARKAVNVPDNSKARAQRGNTTSQQKPTAQSRATKTSGVTGRQAKGKVTNKAFNKDEPGGEQAHVASPVTRRVTDTMNPKGAVNREGAGGYGANSFTGKRGVAAQKSYPTTPLRDGTGAKGADGK